MYFKLVIKEKIGWREIPVHNRWPANLMQVPLPQKTKIPSFRNFLEAKPLQMNIYSLRYFVPSRQSLQGPIKSTTKGTTQKKSRIYNSISKFSKMVNFFVIFSTHTLRLLQLQVRPGSADSTKVSDGFRHPFAVHHEESHVCSTRTRTSADHVLHSNQSALQYLHGGV